MAVGAGGRRSARRAEVVLAAVLLLGAGCSMLASSDADEAPAPGSPAPAGDAPRAATPALPPPAGAAAASAAVPAARASDPAARTATRVLRVAIDSAPPTCRVVIALDGAAEPEVSLLVNHRLVIDIPGVTSNAVPRVIEGAGDPLVERVRVGQHADPVVKARIVIDLRDRADFGVRAQGDRIVAFLAPADAGALAADGAAPRVLIGAEPSGVRGPDAAPAVAGSTTGESAPLLAGSETATVESVPPRAEPRPVPSAVAGEAVSEPAVEAARDVRAPAADAVAAPAPDAPAPADEPAAPSPGVAAADVRGAPPPSEPTGSAPPPIAERDPGLEASPAEVPVAADDARAAAAPAQPLPLPTPETSAPLVEATAASKRISIDFTQADVRTVIELIAAAGGYRVLFTPDVGGVVTIALVDRPWQEALATVLQARRLREVRHEDVMLVSPLGRAAAE